MIEAIITFITQAETVKYVLVFIFGGGLFTAIKTWIDHAEFKQNAKTAKMKTPVEVDNLKVAGLEVLAKNLQEDNKVLREERTYWKTEYDVLKVEVVRLSDELGKLEDRNAKLRKYIDDLQKHIALVSDNSPACLQGREDVYDEPGHPQGRL